MEEEKKRTKDEINSEYSKLVTIIGDIESKVFLMNVQKAKILQEIKKLDDEMKVLNES